MANKKVSQLTSKPSVLVTDLFPIADPTTGQLFKTTISALGTAIGSGVSSVNTLVGAVVLDTDDIQELASPTNRWYTDTRSRAALSAVSPLVYNSGTGAFSIPAATASVNGYLTSTDWTTFNAKQAALSGTGFVKISGTTISYDNSTYLTTSAAASTYLALAGGTLTGALNGTSANFSGDLTLTGTNPRFYLTDSDNNPDYFISNTDGTFTVYDVTNSVSRLTLSTLYTTLNNTAKIEGDILLKQDSTIGPVAGYTTIASDSSGIFLRLGTASSHAYIVLSSLTNYRNFTLPDATGTFALTSDLSAYLPLSGGTLTGNLNGTSASFNKSTNGTLGAIGSMTMGIGTSNDTTTKHSSLGFGYNAGTYYPAYIAFVNADSAGVTKGEFRFAVRDVTTDTAPTVALTIQTSGAATFTSTITATGATLTGALSGTSASFSSTIATTGDITITKASPASFIANNTSASGKSFRLVSADDGTFRIQNTGVLDILTLASTGAATFSSSVTADGLFKSNQGIFQVFAAGTFRGGLYNYASSSGSGTDYSVTLNSETGLYFTTGGSATQKMVITSAGNVGIGTTAPGSLLHLASASAGYQIRLEATTGTNPAYLGFKNSGGQYYIGADNSAGTALFVTGGAAYALAIVTESARAITLGTDNTERMRITSGGNLLINGTSNFGVGKLEITYNGQTQTALEIKTTHSDGNNIRFFNSSNTVVGRIYSDASSTSYITSSDYRLKEDLKPIKGLEIVNKIKVYDYKWKDEDRRMDGVLAHELQEVLPYAVNGIKDGLQMQGVDYSKIVPVMVQAIKELKAKIETLENK
jgi:hypothetical protein